jgi:competence protein ComEC
VGVTIAAQVGVAPVLVPVFGGVPLASLPANVLTVPAAGPLMVWGLTAGMAAGVLGPPFDAWLHLPSGWLVGWVAAVARWAAGLPLGDLEAPQALALTGVVLLGVALRRWHPATAAAVTTAAVVALLLVPAVVLRPPLHGSDGGNGVEIWRDGGAVVVLVDDPWLAGVLPELRRAGVDRIDVLVLRRGGRRVAGAVVDLRSRVDVRLVLAPVGHRVRDAAVPPLGAFAVGTLEVTVTDLDPSLEVSVRRHPRAPP